MSDFPKEFVVVMRAGCTPGHPLTPGYCLDISHGSEETHQSETFGGEPVRTARYGLLQPVLPNEGEVDRDALRARIAQMEEVLHKAQDKLCGIDTALKIGVCSDIEDLVEEIAETLAPRRST